MANLYLKLPNKIYVLCICMLINGLGNFVLPLITFIFKLKIGYSEQQIGLIITLFIICQAPCLIIGGKLIDHYGRKPLMILSYGLAAICYLMCSLIEPSTLMAVLIILASVFFSISMPVLNTLITDFTNKDNRKGSFSLMYLANNIGFSIAPLLGGLMFASYLNVLFIINAVSMIISLILFCIFIQEPVSRTYEEKENQESIADVFSSKKSTLAVLARHPILIVTAAVMFIYQFSYSQWGFLLPLQMVDQFSDGGTRLYGIVAGVNGVAVILLTPFLTYRLRNIGSIKLIVSGGICYAAAFLVFGFADAISIFVAGIIIMTLGEVMIVMNYNIFLANNVPESHRGRILSLLPIITGAGYALGPVVVGKYTYMGYTVLWILLGMSVFLAAVTLRIIPFSKKQHKYQL